jgi:hypothetical protein
MFPAPLSSGGRGSAGSPIRLLLARGHFLILSSSPVPAYKVVCE